MGISACFVAALLALLGSIVDFSNRVSLGDIGNREQLTVHIRKSVLEPSPDVSIGDQADHSLPMEELALAEHTERQQIISPASSPDPDDESRPVTDWRLLADKAAQVAVDELFRQEKTRASMWRQTHSTMFKPAGDTLSLKEEPILADFRFTPRIHVAGLGVTIGSCFIGIPFVGVPVEQRTAAIRVFVCAGDSG